MRVIPWLSALGALVVAALAQAQSLWGEEPAVPGEASASSTEQVLAEFLRVESMDARERPNRTLSGNFLGGAAQEQVFAFRSTLVFIAGDVPAGRYEVFDIPLLPNSRLMHLGGADVTGDGRCELFARLRQPLEDAPDPTREIVLVLSANDAGHFTVILAREVTRRDGEHLIENRVVTRAGTLTIRPGRSVGWTAADYPYARAASQGIEPVLLPWADKAVRYGFEAGKLRPR